MAVALHGPRAAMLAVYCPLPYNGGGNVVPGGNFELYLLYGLKIVPWERCHVGSFSA